jgi:hypothetical protein
MITVMQCRQEAALYASKAKAEPHIGMRSALLKVSQSWQAIAGQIERLEIVREINTPLN